MGKVFSNLNASKDTRHKRKLKCQHNKYLKPGALAQQHSHEIFIATPYADLGKKRVAVLDDGMLDYVLQHNLIVQSPSMQSPMKASSPIAGFVSVSDSNIHLKTSKTPVVNNAPSDSILESLPMDILVKIVCNLHHDQLKPAFHVSQRLRKAVISARQFHFNFTTPDRSRQEIMCVHTPVRTEQWPFIGYSKGDASSIWVTCPRTPNAPKPAPRPPPRLKYTDMRQIAADLFQEACFPSRYMVPAALQRPPCKSVACHRVLFYEELC